MSLNNIRALTMDPEQDLPNVGPRVVRNLLIVLLEYFLKVNFEKSADDT